MAACARKLARDPDATTPANIQALRDSGLHDGQIFSITAFVTLRLAFSTINDSLGAQPDAQLAQSLPPEVRGTTQDGDHRVRPGTPAGPAGPQRDVRAEDRVLDGGTSWRLGILRSLARAAPAA